MSSKRGIDATIEIAAGPRATEARLLELLAELRDEARRDPRLLALPVRVLVPSRSLRVHVSERVARELGAAAGIVVQTLHAAAVEILDRAGENAGGGEALVELLARRLGSRERALREAFEPFRDGYRPVAATVRDLLDAGLEPDLAEPALERLAETRAGARAQAAVRVAAEVARATGGSALLRRAREAFERDAATLPARALFVHGFADATGRATDLIEALVRRLPARVLLDHPPDLDELAAPDPGCLFARRLQERLEGVAGPARPAGGRPARTHVELFRAPGAQAEAREVARRVRALVDAGARPEAIGIVARDLGGYRAALRTQLGRLGVPFSGLRATSALDGAGRRVHALLELLEEGERAPADRWLDAVARLSFEREVDGDVGGEARRVERPPSPELRLGLRVLGAGRLAEVAALDASEHLERVRLRLPVRTGTRVGVPDRDTGEPRTTATQARLAGAELRAAIDGARGVAALLARWPERAPVARHLEALESLRRAHLGWRPVDRAEQRVRPALERLVEAVGDEPLDFGELALLARRSLVPVAAPALGGKGGGVAVLDVMEARARIFEDLFVLGLNRDVFPRVASEDPLLGDDARAALVDVLPDVPIKARGRDEDRFLFAQLLFASSRVTLSWQLAGDDGKPLVASPFVERLLGERDQSDEKAVKTVDPVLPQDAERAGADDPRPAAEHAVLAGLAGAREGWPETLALALGEARGDGDGRASRPVADARARVLAAYERGPFEPEALGPWLGFLGAQDAAGARMDPRVEAPYVTRLEDQSRCPWQTALTKLLRLEPSPDPHDSLPAVKPFVVGNVVHEVLERIARERIGDDELDLAAALAREPVRVPWPEREHFEELLLTAAREAVRRERAPLPGLVEMIAHCARPYLDRARAFLEDEARRWPEGGVLGVEVRGRARVPHDVAGTIDVAFRADRVERRGDTVVLTDYKTGAPTDTATLKKTGIPGGRYMQPIAYALAAEGPEGEGAVRGRYLFLKADPEKDEVDVALGARWREHLGDFSGAVGALVDGWLAGTFFPRLADARTGAEPPACRFCDVSSACLRGDSGARRALEGWVERKGPLRSDAAALRRVWQLAAAEREEARP